MVNKWPRTGNPVFPLQNETLCFGLNFIKRRMFVLVFWWGLHLEHPSKKKRLHLELKMFKLFFVFFLNKWLLVNWSTYSVWSFNFQKGGCCLSLLCKLGQIILSRRPCWCFISNYNHFWCMQFNLWNLWYIIEKRLVLFKIILILRNDHVGTIYA